MLQPSPKLPPPRKFAARPKPLQAPRTPFFLVLSIPLRPARNPMHYYARKGPGMHISGFASLQTFVSDARNDRKVTISLMLTTP
jgi:hypothetical protein